MSASIDILMVTYNRPLYTRLSLERLFDTATRDTRVWLWHNGSDEPTLDVIRQYVDHPRLHKFYHSKENLKLREPTNWFLTEASGPLLSKVDDDLLMPYGWIERMVAAHVVNPDVGVLGTWPFLQEDIQTELAEKKVIPLEGDEAMMLNCWVNGGGVVVKKKLVNAIGLIRKEESFPKWSMRACAKGFKVGWLYPFIICENMDDPRSEHCRIKTDEDARRFAGLSNQNLGLYTVEATLSTIKEQALGVQQAPYDIKLYAGFRAHVGRAIRKFRRMVSR